MKHVVDNSGSFSLSIQEYWDEMPPQYRDEFRTFILDNGMFFASKEEDAIKIAGGMSNLGI